MKGFKYNLYLGRAYPGGEVTRGQFDRFIDQEVMPRFCGCTITDGLGYWKGASERCWVLTILDGAHLPGIIANIAKAYKTRFNQESVLIETIGNDIDFI